MCQATENCKTDLNKAMAPKGECLCTPEAIAKCGCGATPASKAESKPAQKGCGCKSK